MDLEKDLRTQRQLYFRAVPAAAGCGPWTILLIISLLTGTNAIQADPVTAHPRLWVRAEDLPGLRARMRDSNPVYRGLAILVDEAKADMDGVPASDGNPAQPPNVPQQDAGSREPEYYATEKYAELFAFMSLISPDAVARDDYARRATNLLMYVMNQAVLGPADGVPFRAVNFFTEDSNRARTLGEGWPLTVDWVYPYLSATDKATIRTVFLRWSNEIEQSGYHRPEPIGVTNDPVLFADHSQVRWAANNHFNGNNRNLGFMSLVFDPADDPGQQLRNHLGLATGASLYLTDELMRTDCVGGLFPEGPEYSPQSLGYVAQLLFALETTGQNDPVRLGRQVSFAGNPFWDEVLPAYLHTLSPAERINPAYDFLGPIYEPAWYGDSQDYFMPDHINLFGPLALHDQFVGNLQRLQAFRWTQTFMPAGGESGLPDRVRDSNSFTRGILYYLLFDPDAADPADPHPALPLVHYSPGLGRLLARTSWATNATWFTYKLSWSEIDHQLADGNQFEFYRRGEWLTKERSGYDLDDGSSDNHNTLAVQNDDPGRDPDDYRELIWARGSQWGYGAGGSPQVLARSLASDFIYLLGDATTLYNSTYNEVTNVQHVSRSLVWLKPDHVVIYDRAATFGDHRFKRFWLNLPTQAVVTGNRAVMITAAGQQLAVTSLLPAGGVINVETNPVPPLAGDVANGEPMTHRLRVDAPGNPKRASFLHVLQGGDAGVNADSATLIESSIGTAFAGTVVHRTVLLFPVNLDVPFNGTTYSVPVDTRTHLITGLVPDAGYTVTSQTGGANVFISVSTGGSAVADAGGVLKFTLTAPDSLMLSVRLQADGILVLNLPTTPGKTITIEASTDLLKWIPLGSAQPVGNGQLEFRDPLPTVKSQRFYRAVAL